MQLGVRRGRVCADIPLPGLHDFMAQLFVLITQHHPGTAINELDLFHGHVAPSEAVMRERDFL